jgi:hypothetical protein
VKRWILPLAHGAVWFSCLLGAALALGAPTTKLAAPNFTALNVPDSEASYYTTHFASQLALTGLRVTTAVEIAALMGLERQKQLSGCSDSSSSCVIELANGLGVDALVLGSLAKFNTQYQVNVKILSAADGRQLSVWSSRAEAGTALLDELSRAARGMAADVSETGAATGGVRSLWWAPVVGGAVAGGLGVFFLVKAREDHAAITGESGLPSDVIAAALRDRGKLNQAIGIGGLAVAAAGLLAGGAMFIWGGSKDASGAVAVVPSPWGVSVVGALP